nr:uncharacterized protein LOC115497347 [Taeniopygia guttata]
MARQITQYTSKVSSGEGKKLWFQEWKIWNRSVLYGEIVQPRMQLFVGGRDSSFVWAAERGGTRSFSNASPPRGRRTSRRSGAAGTGGTRSRGSVTATSSLPPQSPSPRAAPAGAAELRAGGGRCGERGRSGGGSGGAGARTGGSVEAKNKNWQKLCSVYKNMKSVLMTKHRNLENHRL